MELVRGALVALLVLGPLAWLHRRSDWPTGWHPLLVFASSALVVLLAGLAGQLRLGVALVALVAAVLLVSEVVRHRATVVATLRDPVTVTLAVSTLVLVAILHGRSFVHYDNFSHWAMVLAVMLDQDALPGPDDTVVAFTTYPLGGTSFLYLVARLVGRAEWVAMVAHSLLVLSCALPLITAAGRRRLVGVTVYLLGGLVVLTHITTPNSLLVDNLVAGLGAAVLIIVLLERDRLLAHPWPLGIIGAALVTVKSSGAFFVVVAMILAVLLLVQQRHRLSARAWARWAVALALPWAGWLLWRRHVATTYPAASESKHSVSLDRFSTVFGEKTPEDVRAILGDLAQAVLTDWRLGLLLLGVMTLAAQLTRQRVLSPKDQRRLVLSLLLTVLAWEASLALMYLLSMPLGEALNLAGLRRYQGTIHVVVALVLLALLARWAAEITVRGAGRLRAGQVVVPALGVLATLTLLDLGRPDPFDEVARHQLEQTLAQIEIAPGDQPCLLLDQADGGYRVWMSRYLTRHHTFRAVVLSPDATALPKDLGECSAILLLDPRPHTAVLLEQGGVEVVTPDHWPPPERTDTP